VAKSTKDLKGKANFQRQKALEGGGKENRNANPNPKPEISSRVFQKQKASFAKILQKL